MEKKSITKSKNYNKPVIVKRLYWEISPFGTQYKSLINKLFEESITNKRSNLTDLIHKLKKLGFVDIKGNLIYKIRDNWEEWRLFYRIYYAYSNLRTLGYDAQAIVRNYNSYCNFLYDYHRYIKTYYRDMYIKGQISYQEYKRWSV